LEIQIVEEDSELEVLKKVKLKKLKNNGSKFNPRF